MPKRDASSELDEHRDRSAFQQPPVPRLGRLVAPRDHQFVFGAIREAIPCWRSSITNRPARARNSVSRSRRDPQPDVVAGWRAMAFSASTAGRSDLFVYDLTTNTRRQLTNDAFADLQPAWSPESAQLVFVTDRLHRLDTSPRAGSAWRCSTWPPRVSSRCGHSNAARASARNGRRTAAGVFPLGCQRRHRRVCGRRGRQAMSRLTTSMPAQAASLRSAPHCPSPRRQSPGIQRLRGRANRNLFDRGSGGPERRRPEATTRKIPAAAAILPPTIRDDEVGRRLLTRSRVCPRGREPHRSAYGSGSMRCRSPTPRRASADSARGSGAASRSRSATCGPPQRVRRGRCQ